MQSFVNGTDQILSTERLRLLFPEFLQQNSAGDFKQQDAGEFLTKIITNCTPLLDLCSFITKTSLKCKNCNDEKELDQGIDDSCNIIREGITNVTIEDIQSV